MESTKKKCDNLIYRPVITEDPEKLVEEYFKSKKQELSVKKYPPWDVARVNPAAELVECRRELSRTENELEEKKLEREKKRIIMTKEWTDLRRKEELLRQSLIKFNKFVKENNEKRERAQHKIAEERERRTKCHEQIDELAKEIEYIKTVREHMRERVQEYKMYQNYLDSVVNETNEEFQSIGDIFNRYESLVESRNILAQHQDQNLEALELTGTEMQHMTEEKGQMLVDLNNKLALLQGRYERAKAEALRWQTIVSRIKATAAAKNLELTRVKFCCWSMYQQLCKRKGYPIEVDQEDVENQLAHIKRTIVELKRITKAARKKAASEKSTVS
ncbi:coiled-coil domain-containing protein 42 like-2 [Venturia canescens]|uniref:coiled-coil domain-containing protein 42 like-2 n=1 Tax=Venturia canescens TaxID=32260 RepID=UPI001C9BF8A0|nr:coiled-coil domain-containing protein 42 like-2 [Venturia canescens]XP_043282040.1 coiled-coil domain-containing protein 42 like-2 [Venturia canescens]